jgi:hypothetical protein
LHIPERRDALLAEIDATYDCDLTEVTHILWTWRAGIDHGGWVAKFCPTCHRHNPGTLAEIVAPSAKLDQDRGRLPYFRLM